MQKHGLVLGRGLSMREGRQHDATDPEHQRREHALEHHGAPDVVQPHLLARSAEPASTAPAPPQRIATTTQTKRLGMWPLCDRTRRAAKMSSIPSSVSQPT